MRIQLVSVGRIKADPTAPLVSDYAARIQKFLPFEDTVLKVEDDARVAQRMVKAAQGAQVRVALDERGKLYDSFEFSNLVSSWMNAGHQQVNFVIGGAAGLPTEIVQQADILLALSRMTLPHRFARLLLCEQIYRALCIIRNVPYQK